MRFRYTLVAVAMTWAISGCNTADRDTQTDRIMNDPIVASEGLELALSSAFVEVMPYQAVDRQFQDYYDFDLRVTYDGSVAHDRTLRLAKSVTSDGTGIKATLLDGSDDLVVSVTQRWGIGSDSAIHYTLQEITPSTEFKCTKSVEGKTVTETYDVDGIAISLNYESESPSEDSAIAAFAEYFTSPSLKKVWTPSANVETTTMLMLVNSAEFVSWVTESVNPVQEPASMAKPACDLECICYGAATCAMVSCPIGGTLNPACNVCAAGVAGCAVVAVASWLFDW